MARPCSKKSQKLDVAGSMGDNANPSVKCIFKMNFPPAISPKPLCPGMKQESNFRLSKLNDCQNPISRGKLRFQCHYEDRKRRAEVRRKRIIQNLKKTYAIDLEGLNEDVTREIIMKAEIVEREKRQKEKRNVERMVTMITRLLEEQRYKNRGKKISIPPCRKPLTNFPGSKEGDKETDNTGAISYDEEKITFGEAESQIEVSEDVKLTQELSATKRTSKEALPEEEEGVKEVSRCVDVNTSQGSQVLPYEKLVRERKFSCKPVEKYLQSTPKRVVFNDYEKGKVYLQDLKITNVGLETIHCRYLGIVVHTKGEDRFPVGVAVRDNVKLRPGLCCSTKIRLCSQEDTKELLCSVVYETRRQRNPQQHFWFFVPVVCVPVRAIVRVFPLKITFPSLTWCEATGPEGTKLLRKTLKIENSGARACCCRITNFSYEPKSETPVEYEGEAEGEVESVKNKSLNSEPKNSETQYTTFTYSEVDGECMSIYGDGEEIAATLMDELFENIFSAFRFSAKYHIDLPPFTTVRIEVRFFPHYKGFHHEMYLLQFEDCDNCGEQSIELVGDIKQIPLRVEPKVIDLKICIINSGVYAGTFKIFNESKGPFSVVLRLPASIKNHAHVYPRESTIPPSNSSDFSVRIYPRVTLATDAPRYYNRISQVLEFPIFIHPTNVGACKRDCIKIHVFALVTDYCLELSPPFVDFGVVSTVETVRTELELTNHSLALQEFGFLNLPQGVRVEPNMGFGRILPKETITLYLHYSPEEDLIRRDENAEENHEFQVVVTSIAKYGGFREKLKPDEESAKYSDLIREQDYNLNVSITDETLYEHQQYIRPENSEDSGDFDVCDEESSVESEELCLRVFQYENKIREFLQLDDHKLSEPSNFKRMLSQEQNPLNEKDPGFESSRGNSSEFGEVEEIRELKGISTLKPDVVNCKATIVQPRCRFSETVIQLPATSCSSFSLYRFRLECIKKTEHINCSCGFRKVVNCGNKEFECSFEFQYVCHNIKLEPESGFIKPGESLPITIIHRPEFPAEQLQYESRLHKGQKFEMEAKAEKEKPQSTQNLKPTKGNQVSASNKMESGGETSIEGVMNAASYELENSDVFSGEKNLAKLINPFFIETKLRCLIKIKFCKEQAEKTEIHEIVLICPAIKPKFIYLGDSNEIKFNKVFVGTRSKKFLQIQNISLERTSPSATLLNPIGPFFCPAGLRNVEVDPEHVWRQPLIYAPLEEKGIEKQFFEIYCDSTNIFLTVSGEGVQPEYKLTPKFACCQIETMPGFTEEVRLEMENLSSITMTIQLSTVFVKERLGVEEQMEKDWKPEDESTKSKKEKPGQKDESKDRKKSKNTGNENFQFWDEVPEVISSALEEFEEVHEKVPKVFSLVGVKDNNEVVIPPSGRQQIKVQFKLPADEDAKIYAIKYAFELEGVSTLKEILLVGKPIGRK